MWDDEDLIDELPETTEPAAVTYDDAAAGYRPCEHCDGNGLIKVEFDGRNHNPIHCPECEGAGYLGIAPERPTYARPGSKPKVAVLVARYAAGVELWHPRDFTGDPDDGDAERC